MFGFQTLEGALFSWLFSARAGRVGPGLVLGLPVWARFEAFAHCELSLSCAETRPRPPFLVSVFCVSAKLYAKQGFTGYISAAILAIPSRKGILLQPASDRARNVKHLNYGMSSDCELTARQIN